MKRLKSRLIFASVCFAIVFISLKNKEYAASYRNYYVEIDPIISQNSQCEIKDFIEKHYQLRKKISPSHFSELLVQRFPYLNSVHIKQNIAGFHAIALECSSPTLRINDSYILNEKNQLIVAEVFAPHTVADLYTLAIASPLPCPVLTNNMQKIIAQLSARFFESYRITLINDAENWFNDINNPQFAVLFDAQTMPDDAMLGYCNYIKNELGIKGIFEKRAKKKSNIISVADIRFKNQIIVRDLGGEQKNG